MTSSLASLFCSNHHYQTPAPKKQVILGQHELCNFISNASPFHYFLPPWAANQLADFQSDLCNQEIINTYVDIKDLPIVNVVRNSGSTKNLYTITAVADVKELSISTSLHIVMEFNQGNNIFV